MAGHHFRHEIGEVAERCFGDGVEVDAGEAEPDRLALRFGHFPLAEQFGHGRHLGPSGGGAASRASQVERAERLTLSHVEDESGGVLNDPAHRPAAPPALLGPYVNITEGPLPVSVQVARRDGRLVCTGLLVGWAVPPAEVTAGSLRRIRLGQILATLDRLTAAGEPLEELAEDAAALAEWKHPGPAGHDDEHYQNVARLYREAVRRSPRSPVRWLARQMHASPATVHRWLAGARDRGFLERSYRRGPTG